MTVGFEIKAQNMNSKKFLLNLRLFLIKSFNLKLQQRTARKQVIVSFWTNQKESDILLTISVFESGYLFPCFIDTCVTGGVINQSVPIVLPVSTEDKERLLDASSIALNFDGKPVAVLRSPEFFEHRKEERVSRQFGLSHPDHPYIKMINESGL